MIRLTFISVLLSLLLISTGCNQDAQFSSIERGYGDQPESSASPSSIETLAKSAEDRSEKGSQSDGKDQSIINPKIMKSATLSIESKDMPKTKSLVDSILAKFNGFYEREDFSSNYYEDRYDLVLRIEADKFDNFLDFIGKSDNKILSKSVTANDITEEYIDIKSRVKNNEAYIAKYRSLLSNATSIKDILDIQNQIRFLEEERDSRMARLQYLDSKVDLSTININLIQKTNRNKNEESFLNKIINAFEDSLTLISSFFLFLIRVWPFIIMIFLAFLGVRKWRNR